MTKNHADRYKAAIQLLRDSRLEAGLTQAAVAERLGTRQQFVSKYESGERRLDVIEFLDAARAIGLIPEQIMSVLD